MEPKDLDADPFVQFDRWFGVARAKSGAELPEACCLSTIDGEGYPDARMVLLKARDAHGFVFYTNHNSAKGRALEAIPRAALTFFWEKLQRQVRVQGHVEPVSDSESDEYFATRARGSQLGAWASAQSSVLKSRDELLAEVGEIAVRFEGKPVTRPPHWGGFRIVPRRIEFWQGMADRLHDRFVYRRAGSGAGNRWTVERLAP